MATLYVENVPRELYEALREQARKRHHSIAAEVLTLLEENVPTETEIKARQSFLRKLAAIRSNRAPSRGPFPSAEEMQREDRAR
jgi:plasmid stability protein